MAAASSSTSAGAPKAGQTIGKYRLVRELGARSPQAFAGSVTSIIGESELVVVEVISSPESTKEELESFARRARRLALVRHPNLARMREVLVLKDRVAIASDFVEGERLGDLLAHDVAKKLGLVERLRVLVDVLSGLSSIHLAPELTSAGDQEGKSPIHGALDPESILVGTDGSARLVHLVRASGAAGKPRVESPRYAAPELLLGDETAGVRADLYAVGVLLWEMLADRKLFEETEGKDVLARQLAGPLPLATVPADAAWAKPLVEVAARALDVDPEKRHASAAELAGALRLAVQARLAPASRVGAAVTSIAKEKIQARAAWKPAKKAVPIAKSVKLGAAPAKVESKPDDRESTEKKPVPTIARGMKTKIGIPSLAAADDDEGETKRLAIDSLPDDDLFAEEEIEEVAASPKPAAVKKSMPPPLRQKSMAPPVPPPAASSAPALPPTPPPAAPSAPSPVPVAVAVVTATPPPAVVSPPPADVAPAAPSSEEAIATIAPVVTPAAEMSSAPAAHAVAASDSKIEVIPPPEDPQKKKRRAIVFAVLGGAALLLLLAIVKHGTKDDDKTTGATMPTASTSVTTATATAIATTAPETTAAATTTAAPTSTFVAEPVPTPEDTQAQSTTPPASDTAHAPVSHPANPGVTHPATPPAKPHKRPPHSSYEPEGI